MYFQLVESQVLSTFQVLLTQGQPDGGVNLHRLASENQNFERDVPFNWLKAKCFSTKGQPDGGVNLQRRTRGEKAHDSDGIGERNSFG